MKALITQREEMDSHGAERDALEADYIRFFERLGVQLQPISNFTQRLDERLKAGNYDLMILTGGGSLWAECYDGERRDPLQRHRDKVECEMAAYAAAHGIPVLGICRGMQLLNAVNGGKISSLYELKAERPIGKDHPVRLLDTGEVIEVNNFHNDGIWAYNLAEKFRVTALDMENGVVEGFASDEQKILGIQWHPERRFVSDAARKQTKRLISEFLERNIINEKKRQDEK